jgi:4-phospho-D-threonate 3-dehydrogenase / 4-phospho-D-erythronate 3-dehydrogenase
MKPVIGITMGDAAGVGPELILKTLSDKEVYNECMPVVIGNYDLLNKLYIELRRRNIVADLNLIMIDSIAKLKSNLNSNYPNILIYDDFKLNFENIKMGQVNKECGKASILYLSKVVDLIARGLVDGTCSAPVNKEAINLAGYHYNGQTEFFTEITGAKKVVPLIIIGNIRMFQLTAHISLKQVLSSLNSSRIFETIVFADASLKKIGIRTPKISIAGINPHAGENGLLGTEEIEIFKPAIDQAKNKGININGPFPADSLFLRVKNGEFDCIITIYHDQATIAMKLLGIPITMTLGLPFIRTSVGHGTAYDIAGLYIADESIFKKSLIVCAESIKK